MYESMSYIDGCVYLSIHTHMDIRCMNGYTPYICFKVYMFKGDYTWPMSCVGSSAATLPVVDLVTGGQFCSCINGDWSRVVLSCWAKSIDLSALWGIGHQQQLPYIKLSLLSNALAAWMPTHQECTVSSSSSTRSWQNTWRLRPGTDTPLWKVSRLHSVLLLFT